MRLFAHVFLCVLILACCLPLSSAHATAPTILIFGRSTDNIQALILIRNLATYYTVRERQNERIQSGDLAGVDLLILPEEKLALNSAELDLISSYIKNGGTLLTQPAPPLLQRLKLRKTVLKQNKSVTSAKINGRIFKINLKGKRGKVPAQEYNDTLKEPAGPMPVVLRQFGRGQVAVVHSIELLSWKAPENAQAYITPLVQDENAAFMLNLIATLLRQPAPTPDAEARLVWRMRLDFLLAALDRTAYTSGVAADARWGILAQIQTLTTTNLNADERAAIERTLAYNQESWLAYSSARTLLEEQNPDYVMLSELYDTAVEAFTRAATIIEPIKARHTRLSAQLTTDWFLLAALVAVLIMFLLFLYVARRLHNRKATGHHTPLI